MVTRMMFVSVRIGPSPKVSTRRRGAPPAAATMMNAGPETKAEARKRGASSAVFQNGRPPSPQ